ncbi:MAG: hypothetical protein RLZZ568_1123 [Cyanobacteriota bacterium]|jgi:predicted nucleic acid-binding protein
MLTVSNTSPLLNLAIIDCLHLVKKQFQRVYIPEAVFTELKVNENLPGSSSLRNAIQEEWLTVRNPTNEPLIQLLRRELDQGESEAIALALKLNADLILLDEKEGRRIARSLKLNITGILGIALKAWQEGEIKSMSELIKALRTQANFHISPALERKILEDIGFVPPEM